VAEALGPLLGAWILCAMLRRQNGAASATAMTGARAHLVARVLFGAACIVYGAAHFSYAKCTASMVPAWLPSRLAIAHLTGVAHAAAGVSLLVGILPRLAATLEALVLSLFGVLVWFPSFLARPRARMGAFDTNSMLGDLRELPPGGIGLDRRVIFAIRPVGLRKNRAPRLT